MCPGTNAEAARGEVLGQFGVCVIMRAGIAAAGLVAVGLGFWLSSASESATKISSVPTPTTASQISIWGIHNQAHLLPVQQIDDYSLIFTESEPINSERR